MFSLEFIFTQVGLKLYTNLTNATGEIILLDRLENASKIYILRVILEELKKLCINITYYNSKQTPIKYKIDRFVQLLLIRVHKKLDPDLLLLSPCLYEQSLEIKWLIKNFEMENGELLKLILNHFASIKSPHHNSYSGTNFITDKLISSILEDLVIKFSTIVLYTFILNFNKVSIPIFKEVSGDQLWSLKSEKNNLYWTTYFRTTFFRPKYIYTSLYSLKVINHDGLCNKLVYLPILRISEEKSLTTIQFIVLLYFEILEFVSPKMMYFFTFLKKIFTIKLNLNS